jgi:hypothetical protein
MYMIRAANVPAFDAAEKKAQEMGETQLEEDNASWGSDFYSDDPDRHYEPLEYDAAFDRFTIEVDGETTGDIIVDNEDGAPGQDNYYLLVQDGMVKWFLDENKIPFEEVQTIEKKVVEQNPNVLGGDDFYIIDGEKAYTHHVGDEIEPKSDRVKVTPSVVKALRKIKADEDLKSQNDTIVFLIKLYDDAQAAKPAPAEKKDMPVMTNVQLVKHPEFDEDGEHVRCTECGYWVLFDARGGQTPYKCNGCGVEFYIY